MSALRPAFGSSVSNFDFSEDGKNHACEKKRFRREVPVVVHRVNRFRRGVRANSQNGSPKMDKTAANFFDQFYGNKTGLTKLVNFLVKVAGTERERERERALLGTISITGWSRARPADRRCLALCGLD